MAVPRFVWNTVLAAISLALAWGGREHLTAVIVDFLSLLGYWTVCFGVVLAIEVFWFRPRNGGFDLEGWQDQDRMPLGIAGCLTLALGLGVSFLGMDQTWVSPYTSFSASQRNYQSSFVNANQIETVRWAGSKGSWTRWWRPW
jgi:purine-cytosine permease-like protein